MVHVLRFRISFKLASTWLTRYADFIESYQIQHLKDTTLLLIIDLTIKYIKGSQGYLAFLCNQY